MDNDVQLQFQDLTIDLGNQKIQPPIGLSGNLSRGTIHKSGMMSPARSQLVNSHVEAMITKKICYEGKEFYEKLEEAARQKVEEKLASQNK